MKVIYDNALSVFILDDRFFFDYEELQELADKATQALLDYEITQMEEK